MKSNRSNKGLPINVLKYGTFVFVNSKKQQVYKIIKNTFSFGSKNGYAEYVSLETGEVYKTNKILWVKPVGMNTI